MLLKGHTSHIATPDGSLLRVTAPTTWLATAGSGDALAGILGALVATHAGAIAADADVLARLAATACVLHGAAGELRVGRRAVHGPRPLRRLPRSSPTLVASAQPARALARR